VAPNELDKDYDYIIVDTPPSLNVLTDNALVATGNVVIPVIPEKLNANSLQIFFPRTGVRRHQSAHDCL
jgi:chromosome partitioning protein